MTSLDVSYCTVHAIGFVEGMTSMKTLLMDGTTVLDQGDLLRPLRGMTKLRGFSADSTTVRYLHWLARCPFSFARLRTTAVRMCDVQGLVRCREMLAEENVGVDDDFVVDVSGCAHIPEGEAYALARRAGKCVCTR